jgi:flagellar L-ring protein precursor FlgH
MQADGAIYHSANNRPLFEDRRARFVGDTLTVNLVEISSANSKLDGSSTHTGTANVAIGTPTILGYKPTSLSRLNIPGISGTTSAANLDTSFTSNSSVSNSAKESNTNSNAISGTITVTVLEVLPNGNLVVSGEKQLAINEGTEFVRLSGVVNPINITSANAVNSTLLADARIESKEKQRIDTSQVLSMLSRFFVALLPF